MFVLSLLTVTGRLPSDCPLDPMGVMTSCTRPPPSAIVGGVASTRTGNSGTTTSVVVPVLPFTVAEIVVVPSPAALIAPVVGFTTATYVLLDENATVSLVPAMLMILPPLPCTVANALVVPATGIVSFGCRLTSTDVTSGTPRMKLQPVVSASSAAERRTSPRRTGVARGGRGGMRFSDLERVRPERGRAATRRAL